MLPGNGFSIVPSQPLLHNIPCPLSHCLVLELLGMPWPPAGCSALFFSCWRSMDSRARLPGNKSQLLHLVVVGFKLPLFPLARLLLLQNGDLPPFSPDYHHWLPICQRRPSTPTEFISYSNYLPSRFMIKESHTEPSLYLRLILHLSLGTL